MTLKNRIKRLLRFPEPITRRDDFYRKEPAHILQVPAPEIPKGRIVKADKHKQYSPDIRRSGGRVVHVMPRELKKIKAGQEKMTDEDTKLPRLSGN